MQVIYNKSPLIKGLVKDLITEPVVVKVGLIDEASAIEFSKQVSEACNTGQDIIPVEIDSFGGDAYALLTMLSAIENCTLPVATIVKGKAMSAGAILAAHGTKGLRFMCPNATIMLHEVSSFCFGKLTELKVDVQEVERLNEFLFQKMAIACEHKDINYFVKKIGQRNNADWYLNCLEAKKHKLIDELGLPEIEVDISVEVKFCFERRNINKDK